MASLLIASCAVALCALVVVLAAEATAVGEVVPLTLLPQAALEKGAVCLDGSAPGYYWKHAGTPAAEKKWIVHQEGGGWCFTEEECVKRSHSRLGSSKYFAENMTMLHNGFLSRDCKANPVFCNYNLVYMPYCDGGSFSGNRVDPVIYNGTKFYLRGKRILDAIFDEFADHFAQAEEFILTGCSAGGLATYLHADYPLDKLPKTVKYAVLADAGYFADAVNYIGKPAERTRMVGVYKMQNASSGVNQKCISATPVQDQWQCYFAQYTMPHIQSPVFALQSLYDFNQLKNVLNLPCIPPNCSDHYYQIFLHWRTTFLEVFSPFVNGTAKGSGVFADSCVEHCQSNSDRYWNNGVLVGGQTPHQTFYAWYFNSSTEQHTGREIDCPYPCNHHCPRYPHSNVGA